MSHKVLSLKYRPQLFSQLKGQGHVTRILQNALSSDRVGHAYLLVGPRGVGKTTTARIFARALNCSGRDKKADGGFEPCGTCPSCVDIAAGADLDVVEMDAASNNAVDDVRALREQVGYATVRSEYRIWIVDEVHMLSTPAFNAFLKTLEEPPSQVKFLFCTTEEHKLPDTFRSRCQRVEFRPIDEDVMGERLLDLAAREGVTLEEGLPEAIAHAALGGLRDAESQLEQLIAAAGPGESLTVADLESLSGRASGDLLKQLEEAVEARDAAQALDAIDACLAAGAKPGVLLDQWLDRLREQMLGAARSGTGGYARPARAIDVLLAKRMHLRAGAAGDLVLQVAAVELARLPDARDLDALMTALRGAGASGASGGGGARAASAGEASAGDSSPAGPPHRGPAPARAPDPPDQPASRGEPAERAGGVEQSGAAAADVPTQPVNTSPRPVPAGKPLKLDVPTLTEYWDEIIRRSTRRNEALGDALQEATVQSVRVDALRLALPDDAARSRGTLMRREVQLAFGQVLREVIGAYLRVEIVETPRTSRGVGPEGKDMRIHPAVQMVTEATGGRLLNVERPLPEKSAGQRGRGGRGKGPKAEDR